MSKQTSLRAFFTTNKTSELVAKVCQTPPKTSPSRQRLVHSTADIGSPQKRGRSKLDSEDEENKSPIIAKGGKVLDDGIKSDDNEGLEKKNKRKRLKRVIDSSSSESECDDSSNQNVHSENNSSEHKKCFNTSVGTNDTSNTKEKTPTRFDDIKVESMESDPEKDHDSQQKGTVKSFSEAIMKTDFGYDPLVDVFWKRGEKTPYLAFALTLKAIEETSGRLKTIEILSNFFRSVMILKPDELVTAVYLCLNQLAPAYAGIELGIGDMVLSKAIANSTGRSLAHIKKDVSSLGDLGIVAEQSRGSQKTMFKAANLTMISVFSKLKEIANFTGTSSQNLKVSKIQSMLVACRECESRYLIRSLSGKLRIGLAEQSVLQAIAHAITTNPIYDSNIKPFKKNKNSVVDSQTFKVELDKNALAVKTAYCKCPNYDKLISALLDVGPSGLHEVCKLSPGIPLKPMLAHPTKGVSEVLTRFENMKFTCEWKYDGERAQIHLMEDGMINIFSRNQENNTSKYPDIISRFKNCLTLGNERKNCVLEENRDDLEHDLMENGVKSCVMDSEAVAWNKETKEIMPFQVLSTRKRKDAKEEDIKVEVAIFAFDLLYLNGLCLTEKPFRYRRSLLMKAFTEVDGQFFFAKNSDPQTVEQIQEILELSIKEKCEGLMVKTLDDEATYEIAKRSHNWLKLKKDYLDGLGDTLDLVVVGGFLGRGKRTGTYGGFLLACYDSDNEEYQTICKIGTGFSDSDLTTHYEYFKDKIIDQPKSYYSFDDGPQLQPDHWFEPVQVWEVKAADLSISPVYKAAMGRVDAHKGISLRFPRFIRIREDKNVEDASSSCQIASMYENQEQIKSSSSTSSNKQSSNVDYYD